MRELEYPENHPANRDVRGTNMIETHTDFGYDYPPNHPARGGQGQPVLTRGAGNVPVDGHKHLFGLPGKTLAESEKLFAALSEDEQARRREWNKTGVPVELIEEG